MIWVGDSGESLLKLIQEVAGSQHCAQVCPPDSYGSGIRGKCKEQSKALDDHTSGGPHRDSFQIFVLTSSPRFLVLSPNTIRLGEALGELVLCGEAGERSIHSFIHSSILSLNGRFGSRSGASSAVDQRLGRREPLPVIHNAGGY